MKKVNVPINFISSMETIKAVYKNAWPYLKDKLNLPVKELETAVPFYETVMAFQVVSRGYEPYKSIILKRDNIQIGLAENNGDPSQEGCFFEVDDVGAAFSELKANGLKREISGFDIQQNAGNVWKVFFVVAPDGLCYCIGEKQP
jgi:hypothetical protein